MNQQETINDRPSMQEDEISLRDIILSIQKYGKEIRRKWLLVLLVMFPFVGYFSLVALQKKVTYKAKLTFTLNEGGGGTGLTSILGSFGGLLGSGGGDYQMEKIMEIARSRRIISEALFDTITYDGRKDFFANFLIEKEQIAKGWEEDKELKGFRFTNGNKEEFSRKENRALLRCYAYFVGGEKIESNFSISLNEDSGVLTITIITTDESLSIDLTNALYQKISSFYVEKSVESEARTYSIMQHKKDSITQALKRNDISSANHEDSNNGLLFSLTKVPGKQYSRNDQMLTLMYGEAVKNAELADFALKSSTPFLTVIDTPIAPIKPTSAGKTKTILMGIMLGLLAGAVFVCGRKKIRDILKP